jgi:hypothetical protein
MRTWLGVILGVAIGLAIIYLPLLVSNNGPPSLTVSTLRVGAEDLSVKAENGLPFEKLTFPVAIVALSASAALAAYLLTRWHE